MGCGICVRSCPAGALKLSENKRHVPVLFDPAKCRGCFVCAEKCPQGAVKQYGRVMSVRDVVREISKDEIFFFYSGGGVTLSGGEPLSQPDFAAEILRNCRELGIHTAIETSLYAPPEAVAKMLPWLDVLYVDLKYMEGKLHRQWTGADNSLILGNLSRIEGSAAELELIVRIPLVPGVNDSDENLTAAAEFCKSLGKLREIELLPYHRLGLETYRNLGRDYLLADVVPPTRAHLLERSAFIHSQSPGVPVRAGGEVTG